ncbi:MAG: exo-alpha-sialidase [Actinobacteria bacterium]|nr:exo-alpha-sialidase [Actinomycetota bacterium]
MGGRLRVICALGAVATLLAPAAARAVVGDGTTFTDAVVSWGAPPAQAQVAVATPFASVVAGPVSTASDRAGNLYAAWSDGHHIWEASSRDQGATWTAPARVDVGPGTALLPVVLAGDQGRVAVAYYKTPYSAGDAPGWAFPLDAVWWVSLAESTGGRVFAENRATSSVHYGAAPTEPLSLAVQPRTGLAVVTYASDVYDPQQPAAPGCDAARSNTQACLHVMQAVQTSGPRLLRRR